MRVNWVGALLACVCLFDSVAAQSGYVLLVGLGADNAVGLNTPSSFTTSDADIRMSNGTALPIATEPGTAVLSASGSQGRSALHSFAARFKTLGYLPTGYHAVLINCGQENTLLVPDWNASGAAYLACASLFTSTVSLLTGGLPRSVGAFVVQLGEHDSNHTRVVDLANALQSLAVRVRGWTAANNTTPFLCTALPTNFTGVQSIPQSTSRVFENVAYLFPYAAAVVPQPTYVVANLFQLDDASQYDLGERFADAFVVARNRSGSLLIRVNIPGWVNHWTFDDTFVDDVGSVEALAADASDFSGRRETNSGRSRFGKVYRHPGDSCVGLRLAPALPNMTLAMWHITPDVAQTRFVLSCDPLVSGQCTAFVSGYGAEQIRFSPSYVGLYSVSPLNQPAIGEWFFATGAVFGMAGATYSQAGVDAVFDGGGATTTEEFMYDTLGQFTGNSGMILGASETNPGGYCDYNGLSDDLMVFNRVLDGVEMHALYLQTHEQIVVDMGTAAPPTHAPSTSPTPGPTVTPGDPTPFPTTQPTRVPTSEPTLVPSGEPTSEPTLVPTATPTRNPSARPTARPTRAPTSTPSAQPTAGPTVVPGQPSPNPTAVPSAAPTVVPSAVPTTAPSAIPSAVPTADPSAAPSSDPTQQPSAAPTTLPTGQPSAAPSAVPTGQPTLQPSAAPSAAPTGQPTANPTLQPSVSPTGQPTAAPTRVACPDGEGRVNDTACAVCEPGSVASSATDYTCANCSLGRFQGLSGQSSCFFCILFRYQGATGATVCENCAPGRYTTAIGASVCLQCAPGFFTTGLGSLSPFDVQCEGCPAGRYSLAEATTCINCETGRYAPTGNRSSCLDCIGISNTSACTPTSAPTPAPTSAPTAVPSPAPTPAPTPLSDETLIGNISGSLVFIRLNASAFVRTTFNARDPNATALRCRPLAARPLAQLELGSELLPEGGQLERALTARIQRPHQNPRGTWRRLDREFLICDDQTGRWRPSWQVGCENLTRVDGSVPGPPRFTSTDWLIADVCHLTPFAAWESGYDDAECEQFPRRCGVCVPPYRNCLCTSPEDTVWLPAERIGWNVAGVVLSLALRFLSWWHLAFPALAPYVLKGAGYAGVGATTSRKGCCVAMPGRRWLWIGAGWFLLALSVICLYLGLRSGPGDEWPRFGRVDYAADLWLALWSTAAFVAWVTSMTATTGPTLFWLITTLLGVWLLEVVLDAAFLSIVFTAAVAADATAWWGYVVHAVVAAASHWVALLSLFYVYFVRDEDPQPTLYSARWLAWVALRYGTTALVLLRVSCE